jgi:hypothetical protein
VSSAKQNLDCVTFPVTCRNCGQKMYVLVGLTMTSSPVAYIECIACRQQVLALLPGPVIAEPSAAGQGPQEG